jgi:trans-2,3-dihydro-3-hydroxyanthranilate isomerase
VRNRLYIVDVFAERPYAGNQLAVVVGSETLSDETMQRLAAEMNFSETTFIASAPDPGGYPVRIFTPAAEIAFAGHPILGTAWVVRHRANQTMADPITLILSVGQVGCTCERATSGEEVFWFLAPPAKFGPTCPVEPIAGALGISAHDIDARAPVQQLGTGTSALIVPIRSLDALKRARLDRAAFAPLARDGFPPLVYLFCSETHHPGNDLCARFFFDAHGIREDPATGNGAAFLGAYLLRHGVFSKDEISLRIEQGHEVRRPSLVRLRAKRSGENYEIQVGGRVIPILEGELL